VSPAARQDSRPRIEQRPRVRESWLVAALAAFAAGASAQPEAPAAAASAAATGAATTRATGANATTTGATAPGAAASSASPAIELRRAESLQPPPRGDAARQLPIILRARELHGRPDLDASAEGDVEFRRGGMVIHADKLTYDQAEDLARATGHVVVTRDGNVFSGPELQLKVERFEGFFRTPTYRFARTGAGGKASLIEFIDDQRASATDATYSSCTIEDADGEPVWILKARELHLDHETNEGIARDAVLRFYGVPILASPVLSFPLSEERKSGFLPPSFGIDSRSGLQAAIPYYWNIAPNRDATFTMQEAFRRGPSLDSEFRYLEPSFFGSVNAKLMPRDMVAERERYSLRVDHEGALPYGAYSQLKVMRVSDDDYWKDFPGEVKSLTPRLLQTDLLVSRPFGDWSTYARVLRWQVLQTVDPTTRIDSPYERAPQVGARYAGPWRGGFDVGFEAEVNRFANPDDKYLAERQTGVRTHAIGSIARPFFTPGWSVTPKVSFNAASYSLDLPLADGRTSASRVIPTVSIDSAWTLERETTLFGRAVRQTLEPRLFYVDTPIVRQAQLPNFDSALKDFNFDSLFTENLFSGVDRVSDSNQLTAGVISRILDPDTGAEALRVGLAQRYRFRDQLVTPDDVPQTQRFSDVLVFGSTSLVPRWLFDTGIQFNPDSHRIQRSLASMRYSPGPYRTVGLTYRLSRGLSEQVELGWQWPIYGRGPGERGEQAASGNGCGGTLYGVGHLNYSTRDSRLTDGIVGLEYDAGCWIGRVVVERLSTGRSEATTRLLLQLELVGLSRIGSNPLKVLKDNVPGYQLLREERTTTSPFTPND
jgi:LPS-assembly protein